MRTLPASELKLLRLANALTRSGYADFFQTLVNQLAGILDVDYVFIAEVPEGHSKANTLAVSALGQSAPNFVYDLKGTPCETVPERELCHYNGNVAAQFPDDQLLIDMGIQSYTGMPILTSDGRKLGLLSAMAKSPVQLTEADQEILRIAAAQVGAELELSRSQQRIRSLTYEDAVTGLPNRRRLLDWLDDLDHARSLLLVDIRRFKDINDLHGHVVGDATLYAVAERLRTQLGQRGFLARLAGDQFALVPSEHWNVPVQQQALEIQQWFREPVISQTSRFHVDVTVGAATAEEVPRNGIKSFGNELLRRAGVGLAEAKALNKSVMVFEPSMVDSRHLRQQLYEKLLSALRENRLTIHFQPQVSLQTGELFGAEVLCRWNDPQDGWISPAYFIPLAEERGLINELGDWVLDQTCRQLNVWAQAGYPFQGKLSVNISNQQLEDVAFADRAVRLLADQCPSRLVFELTETAIMQSPEINLRQMELLTGKGFSWAIDDFGTGYSSLAFLTRMHARYLKVDKSFVSRAPNSPHDESVVRTIVAMAGSMDMQLVAEGIETREQLEFLRDIGCQYGQGFFIGYPVDADTFFETWLRKA